MHINRESEAERDARLRQVIASADFVVYDQPYGFVESLVSRVPPAVRTDAVAIVRDDDVWSQLVPLAQIRADGPEPCALFRFQFPSGVDNSGFVGWLASRLKRELGTGVFVVCGHNSERGGIFDYWGCPLALRQKVQRVIHTLRGDDR
jgi:hypothetical protein